VANESRPLGPSAAASRSGAPPGRVVLDDLGIRRAIARIAHEIVERNEDIASLYVVGVPNGGVPLARRLAENLRELTGAEVVVGILDTTLYRDDLLGSGERPPLRRTEMPSAVDDRIVVLVDDVFSTGRTVRAAMDALMDFGRPRAVQVVALIDRGHRELPIKIDYVGKNIPTARRERVVVRGREGGLDWPLEVVVLSEEGDG
jgi:pyrimidine operon attenuation protein/uracil phosphoribosyltransferase